MENKIFSTLSLRIYEVDTGELSPSLFRALLFYCHCIIFIFDITNKKSFITIRELIKSLEKNDKENKIIKLLVANKIDDFAYRIVSEEEIQKYCDNCSSPIEYFKISVKTNENVKILLQRITTIYINKNENYIKTSKSNSEIAIYESERISRAFALYAKTVYKIILLGDGTVGKSSFFKRYFYNDFDENYLLTVGVQDKYKFIKIKDNDIKLQLWDTAGQERFRSLPRKYYQHADGIILIYDVTNRDSFNNVTKWMKDITDHTNNKKKLIIYLVGNKIDLVQQRVIHFSEAREKSIEHNIKTLEISCKLNLNITDLLHKMTNDIFNNGNKTNENKSFFLDENDQKTRSCCVK